MVHALQHAHRLLRPDGVLINVHDLPIPHVLEVHSAGTAVKAGWLLDSQDFRDERAALNALAQVVSEGHFALEDERDFGFNVYVDGVPELQEWLAEGWQSAVLPDRTVRRLESLFHRLGEKAKVVLGVPARMTKLEVG